MSSLDIYYDKDCDLSIIKKKRKSKLTVLSLKRRLMLLKALTLLWFLRQMSFRFCYSLWSSRAAP